MENRIIGTTQRIDIYIHTFYIYVDWLDMYEYLLKEYKMGLGMCDVTDISMENGNFFHVTIL